MTEIIAPHFLAAHGGKHADRARVVFALRYPLQVKAQAQHRPERHSVSHLWKKITILQMTNRSLLFHMEGPVGNVYNSTNDRQIFLIPHGETISRSS
jgi:hypothetical protein